MINHKSNNLLKKVQKKNLVIALWGAPRCVTTAFEKTFSQRPDTEIFHEPFANIYYFSKYRISNLFGDCEDKLDYDSATVIREITAKAKLSPIVFFKDFPYQCLPYFDKNVSEFLSSTVNTFMIRDPHEVLASLYKAEQDLKEKFNGKITEEEFGFNALDKMFNLVTKKLGQKPIVVEANRFRENPKKILTDYCQQIGVTFNLQMLSWEKGKLKQWNNHEAKIHDYWQKELQNSITINPPQKVDVHVRTEHLEMIKKAVIVYNKLSDYAL